MKRYDIEKTGDSYYSFEVVEDKDGDFVKYEDIKHLLEQSDYAKCECCGENMKKVIIWQCENTKCWEME